LFRGYGLALAALALVVFGAYDSYPSYSINAAKLAGLSCKAFPLHPRIP